MMNGEQLRFSQMAGTTMACADDMDSEQVFLNALAQVKTWKVAGQQLELFDPGRLADPLGSPYLK